MHTLRPAPTDPEPTSTHDGTFRSKPGEYHPSGGSASPRCADHVSAGSSTIAAVPSRPGHLSSAVDPSKDSSTSGPSGHVSRHGVRTGAVDAVLDPEYSPASVQLDRPHVRHRRIEHRVPVVLPGPGDPFAVVVESHQGTLCVAAPQEGAGRSRLVNARQLKRGVRSRAPKVAAPGWLPVVAVRPRVGDHLDAIDPQLDRERVSVRVGRNGEEPVRSGVGPTPHLRFRRQGWCAGARARRPAAGFCGSSDARGWPAAQTVW